MENFCGKAIVILHEIYGVNQHMLDKKTQFHNMGYDVYLPSVYEDDRVFGYNETEEAYTYYLKEIGIAPAFHKMKSYLEQMTNKYEEVVVIGYSIGATVGWLLSECGCCNKVVGVYGSRIRDYVFVIPQCATFLFFANDEPGFDPLELKQQLLGKRNLIQISIVNGHHGFDDPYGLYYNEDSAKHLDELIKKVLL